MLYGSIGALGYLFFLESLVFPLPWSGLVWLGMAWYGLPLGMFGGYNRLKRYGCPWLRFTEPICHPLLDPGSFFLGAFVLLISGDMPTFRGHAHL